MTIIPTPHSIVRFLKTNRNLGFGRAKLVFYQAKFAFEPTYVYVALNTGILLLALYLSKQTYLTAHDMFYGFGEALFPPLAAALFVPLILRDRESGVLPLEFMGNFSLSTLYTVRVLLVAAQILIILLALLIGFAAVSINEQQILAGLVNDVRPIPGWARQWLYPNSSCLVKLFILVTPVIFLGGIGSFFAHWALDARAGYLIIFVIWLFTRAAEALESYPVLRLINVSVYVYGRGDWVTPKIVQLCTGIFLFALSARLLRRNENLFA
ncbi:MAG: hypothetical protein HF973_09750 [Chloroflexi bacterium]|nr:hypothetical protein [Chloroflexota bacterium]